MNIVETIGNTPLITIEDHADDAAWHTIYAKAEFMNPSGSVKDRAAWSIIRAAIREGKLTPGKTILDATSGSTGTAYAMIGSSLGFHVELCIPSNVDEGRKHLFLAMGVTLTETSPLEGSDGAYLEAQALSRRYPERYFYANQYDNDNNWKAHYYTTAEEIWRQTNAAITHFVCGAGTSGTFTGTARRLKELNPAIRTVLVQPDSPFHGIEGMKDLHSTILPGFFDKSLVDEVARVKTNDCYRMVRHLAKTKGLLVGISAGANVLAAERLAASEGKDAVVVTILPDSGIHYLDEPVWRDALREGR